MTDSSANARRILALWLPRLSTDRLRRQWARSGAPVRKPLALVAKVQNAMRLVAVDAAAARESLHAGMALADARAMLPALHVEDADPAADAKLLARMADWCERYSPLVALDAQGLLIDATGVAHLFGDEAGMLSQLRRAIAAQGFAASLAFANTAAAASALARYADGAIAQPDDVARATAPLPTEALAADPSIIHGLKRAGLKTIGQVASRGRSELAARFGREFVTLLDRTLGRIAHPISPRTPLPDCMVEHRFAEPVTTDDAIAATLEALAERLREVLERRGDGARALVASFFRADGQMCRIALQTAEPTRDAAIITRLFKERLSALADPLDAGFGFDVVRLSATLTALLDAKVQGFDTNEAERKEIAFLVDRLAARFGTTRILRFHPQDTHIPEAAAVALPAQHAIASKTAWTPQRAPGEAPLRPFRLFDKPEPVEAIAEVPDGPPVRFRWRRVFHTVVHAEGPERIAMEWWRKPGPTRDYYRVEDDHGCRFWLYRDGLFDPQTPPPRWYLHGSFI